MIRTGFVLGFLLVFSAAAGGAEPDKAAEAQKAARIAEATQVFESLYGADLRRVRSTPVPADDIELAKCLLTAAGEVAHQPELLAVLYERACDLALAGPDGYAIAVRAMERLAAAMPDRAAACAEKVVEVRQRQFDTAKAEARSAAGEALIKALLDFIETKVRVGADMETAVLYKRAQAVARAIKSPQAEDIDARAVANALMVKTVREIEDIKALLKKDPANVKFHEKLVRLYLVELDHPAAAAEYLEGVADESLKKFVPAAAKPADTAPELACMEMAEWYRGLGETAVGGARAAMFERAKTYYQRFLQLHTDEDLARTKATMALKKLDEDLKRLAAALPKSETGLKIVFHPERSMKPFPTGYKQMDFPVQQTEDPAGPFEGKPVYFDQHTGQDVVYEVRSPKAIKQVVYRGAGMKNMTIEILDPGGKVVTRGGPFRGGNQLGRFSVDFEPRKIFLIRLHNEISIWYFINTIDLK